MLNKILNFLYKTHMKETGWKYWSHLWHAFYQGWRLIRTGLRSIIHGIFPFLWPFDGPKMVVKIFKEIRTHEHVKPIIKKEL